MKPDATVENGLGFLPHGPEFRFLDKVVSLTPGKEGTGEYLVRGDEFFLRGHFPGDPIFPGVLLVEAAAQLAGVVAQSDPGVLPLAGLKLTAIRAVKLPGAARPGRPCAAGGPGDWPAGQLGSGPGARARRGEAHPDGGTDIERGGISHPSGEFSPLNCPKT